MARRWQGPSGRAWDAARQSVLERDRYTCQIQLPGKCTGKATCVDHIRPIAEGGEPLDFTNLRAACNSCNKHLGAVLGGKRLAMKQNRWSRAW